MIEDDQGRKEGREEVRKEVRKEVRSCHTTFGNGKARKKKNNGTPNFD